MTVTERSGGQQHHTTHHGKAVFPALHEFLLSSASPGGFGLINSSFVSPYHSLGKGKLSVRQRKIVHGEKIEIAKAKTSLEICDLNDLKRRQKVEFFQVVWKEGQCNHHRLWQWS